MTYIITLDGLPLCYYGRGVYGWGTRPSISRGPLGQVVRHTMREEAQAWIDGHPVFCAGAKVECARETASQPLQDVHAV